MIVMMGMMILVGRRIRGGDVSGEKGVRPLRKGTKTCCCPCSRKTVMTYSQREGLSVTQITPAPQLPLQRRVTIIMVIHSNLNLTCNKKYTCFIRRVQHSECHVVNSSHSDTHEMCNILKTVPQYSATRAQ
jgi:hypothetical protein